MSKKIVIATLFTIFMLLSLPTISASSIDRTRKIDIEQLKEFATENIDIEQLKEIISEICPLYPAAIIFIIASSISIFLIRNIENKRVAGWSAIAVLSLALFIMNNYLADPSDG